MNSFCSSSVFSNDSYCRLYLNNRVESIKDRVQNEALSISQSKFYGTLTVQFYSAFTKSLKQHSPPPLLTMRFRYRSMLCKGRVQAVYYCMTATVYENSCFIHFFKFYAHYYKYAYCEIDTFFALPCLVNMPL